jgi:hypothetical protein
MADADPQDAAPRPRAMPWWRWGAAMAFLALSAPFLARILNGSSEPEPYQPIFPTAVSPAWALDAAAALGLILLAAAVEGAGRGEISMRRALAHGWRLVNRVSAPRTGPTRPVQGLGQAALAHAYFLFSAVLGALIASQLAALMLALGLSLLFVDYSLNTYLVLSGGLWVAALLLGLFWPPLSWLGGAIVFPAYALLAAAFHGWRILAFAAIAIAAAAAFFAWRLTAH